MENSVTIQPVTLHARNYLQFDFIGHLSDEIAAKALENWKGHMNLNTKTSIVYNCQKMKGFETNARRNWQAAMSGYKNQIDVIWIVCDNLFILTAAKTMGILTGLPIKVCRTLDLVGK